MRRRMVCPDEPARTPPDLEVLRRGRDRRACPRRHRPLGRRGPPRRRDGPERIGEVDAAHHRRQPRGADERRGAHRRGVAVERCRATTRRAFVGGRSATSSRTSTSSRDSPRRRTSRFPSSSTASRRARRSRPGSPRSSSSGWPIGPGTTPISSRAASASGWPSPGPWSASASSSSPTSRRVRSTRPTARSVMRMILDACKRGVAAVVVTHDAHLASWADRVIFLRDGRAVDHVDSDLSDPSLAAPRA